MTREEMRKYKAMKWCVDNGIRIYPSPIRFSYGKSRPDVNIIVENNGKKTRGNMVFKQDKQGQIDWNNKIDELYETIYKKGQI